MKRSFIFVLIFLMNFPLLAIAQTSISINSTSSNLLEILGYWQSIDRNYSTDNFINPNPKVYITISKDKEENYYLSKFQVEEYLIIKIIEEKDKEFILLLRNINEDGKRVIDSKIYLILLKIEEKNNGFIIDYAKELFGLDQEMVEMKRLIGPNYN